MVRSRHKYVTFEGENGELLLASPLDRLSSQTGLLTGLPTALSWFCKGVRSNNPMGLDGSFGGCNWGSQSVHLPPVSRLHTNFILFSEYIIFRVLSDQIEIGNEEYASQVSGRAASYVFTAFLPCPWPFFLIGRYQGQ
jgi:hypothetical protein